MKTMIREHQWGKNYDNSDNSDNSEIDQCYTCPVQRRSAGDGKWQYRAFGGSPSWVTSDGTTEPDCSDAGYSWFRVGLGDSVERTTEDLETELKTLSERIAADPIRFQQVREELKRRREAKDEQPAPETDEQRLERESRAQRNLDDNLVVKVIMMEAEQARLVVEAQQAKAAQRDAEDRLALVVKHIPGKRKPMMHEAARELLVRHRSREQGPWSDKHPIYGWEIDAVVEASK